MKRKLLSLIVVLFCFMAVSAQTHLKFMGIPINGHINTFSQKLIAKGFKQLPANQQLPDSRLFQGTFSGESAYLLVGYSPKTKTVYYVGVFIKDLSKSIAEAKIRNFEAKFDQKYLTVDASAEGEGVDRWIEYYPAGGFIRIWAEKDTEYSYDYNFYIKYSDDINSNKNQDSEIDDL